ncbi:MFS transporter [Egicoccus sp. AB-alg2]|uniref:MFS transporter n=1 Tax=Egicoccus sp. AB-alg2 TaxID=3242693 RepID=UPI00359EB9DE
MIPWFLEVLRLRALRRRAELDERSTVLLLFARFADEVGSGLLIVLGPTLRHRLGLSVVQLGWCFQALYSVAAVVEPLTGGAIDLVRRRPLLVWGAAGWGAGLLLAAGAPNFGWLLAGFAVVGAASGPLTATADVVLVESHPADVERIASRSTAIDTVGALLAPAAVALAGRFGVDHRLLLVLAGGAALWYALALHDAVLPPPPRSGTSPGVRQALQDVVRVLRDRRARPWLAALVLFEVLDLAELFEPVWLVDVVGASQTFVAVHAVTGTAASFVGLVLLDRWLRRHDGRTIVLACGLAGLVLYPVWLLTPGTWNKLALVVPRDLVLAPLWPILRGRALAALPDRAGTLAGVTSLLGLLPLAGAFAWVAQRAGLTRSLLLVHVLASVVLLLVLRGGDLDVEEARDAV